MRVVKRLVHTLKFRHPPLHPPRGVLDKDIEQVPVDFRVHIMPVVLHPAHHTVLTDNPILHIIQILPAVGNLGSNACLHLVHILRVHKPFKGITCQLLKFLPRVAAENPQHGVIYINQLLISVSMINKKAARHPLRNLLNNGQCTLVKADCKL